MKIVFLLLFLVSCCYQVAATVFAGAFGRRAKKPMPPRTRFCQVKPIHRVASATLQNVETFLSCRHASEGDFYVCSGAPVPPEWSAAHPEVTWLRLRASQRQNGKAATLAQGEAIWSGDIFVVSDADMRCPPDYLEAVLGEFADPEVGVVTCLYRGVSDAPAAPGSLLECLCILDFASSVLVAEKTERIAFAMGSTMAIRRETLEQIGGFRALEPYLADDFQLGRRAAALGWKVNLAPIVLETDIGRPNWSQAWSHQYRWLVTSRVSRLLGHLAFLVTQGILWSFGLLLVEPHLGVSLLLFWCLLRVGLGRRQSLALPGVSPISSWMVVFLPLKDLFYLGLWLSSLVGHRVCWGERTILIDREGRILEP